MKLWRVPLGLLLGLVGAAVVLAVAGLRPFAEPGLRATLLSDCDGAIQEIAIHYVAEAGDMVDRTYREFLQQLPSTVVVYVVCPDESAFEDLVTRIGPTDGAGSLGGFATRPRCRVCDSGRCGY